ncbi:MAG: MFS transporter, partial [Gemmatimonadaceae bacterium]
YRAWFFGFPVMTFPIVARTGFAAFHILDFTAVLLIVGVVAAIARRMRDVGLLTTQRFGFDLMPLILLLAIAVTGLGLTASSMWWGGSFYWFIALTHQAVVVLWLLSLPFGKFFHIIERPASIGVTLYQQVAQDVKYYVRVSPDRQAGRAALCPRCGASLPSARFIHDLEGVLGDLGQRYDLGEGRGLLQDYCPTCKRVLRANTYYALLKRDFL